ncbi:MAG TPA: HTH domain-containing protein [Paludibacter sp.]|nr:HTH domain-containing protein [Paludibacter sp.]
MAKTTFWDIIEQTIRKVGTPLSPKEIWDKANELGTIGDFVTTGKTPWATIGAYCYTDINRAGDTSMIVQTNERPAQFFLRDLLHTVDITKLKKQKESTLTKEVEKLEKKEAKKFNERDLHCILSTFAFGDPHFKAHLKTVFHESSSKGVGGQNEWLHPDLVGVYFPFKDYKRETLDIQTHLTISSIRLFSFELKISLNFTNLRRNYFQAVSNSSWANEGYLVAINIDEDTTFRDELRRLSNAFGIGIIQLNVENIFESEILFPAHTKQAIDWDTVNRLANENLDFSDFLKYINEDCKLGKVKSQYDKVLTIEEVSRYIKDKGINNAI